MEKQKITLKPGLVVEILHPDTKEVLRVDLNGFQRIPMENPK